MAKITCDMLKKDMEDVLAAKLSRQEKTHALSAGGVAVEQDEPPLWHREGKSAWAIYLDANNHLQVLRKNADEVDSGMFLGEEDG